MSEQNEDFLVEEETPILHLELDDGTTLECAVIALFEVEGQDYVALVSTDDLEDDDSESALLLYRYDEDEQDQDAFRLDNIESDEEYEKVTAALDVIFEEESEEE